MARGSETGGCLNCYAARLSARNLPGMVSPTTGKPFARILQSGPRWTGKVELIKKALDLPLRWKKPRKIFVNSLSDLFHEALPLDAIDDVFGIMARCSQHTFQILTKRPERMLEYVSHQDVEQRIAETVEASNWEKGHDAEIDWRDSPPLDEWPLPNVWLGTSIENQETADMRIPLLLQTPAAKRFVSYEPALGPVDFVRWLQRGELRALPLGAEFGCDVVRSLHWIIVGGESGPGARPFDIAWARDTQEQCKAAGVAYFFKQAGANVYDSSLTASGASETVKLKDRKGGDLLELEESMRVREFPA